MLGALVIGLSTPTAVGAFPVEIVGPTLDAALQIPQFEGDLALETPGSEAILRFREHLRGLSLASPDELGRDELAALLLVAAEGEWDGLDTVVALGTRRDALGVVSGWLRDGRYDRWSAERDAHGRRVPADRAAAALCGHEDWSARCAALRELWPGPRTSDPSALARAPWTFVTLPQASARGAELIQRHTDLAIVASLWEDPAAPWFAAIHEAQALSLLASVAVPLNAVQGPGLELWAPAEADEARAVYTTVGGLLGPLRPARARVAREARVLSRLVHASLAARGGAWLDGAGTDDRAFLGAAEDEVGVEGLPPAEARFGLRIAQALARSGGPDGSMVYSLAARTWGASLSAVAPEPTADDLRALLSVPLDPEESRAMEEIRTLQHRALVRAGTASRLWHRLFRQAVDRGDASSTAQRFLADARAAALSERERATWSPPAPAPARDPSILGWLLAGLAFAGFWGWMIVRSLRGMADGGWKTPASGAAAGLALLVLATPVSAFERPSPHQDAMRAHAGDLPFSIESVVGPTAEQIAARTTGGATVMGYLPYWSSPSNLPWSQLDILAYFSVEVDADGDLGSDHGWGDAAALSLIDEAHAAGVSVILSATRFGGSALAPLLGSATNRANCIDNLVARMIAGNGDGLDIDFEGVNLSNREDMVAFVQDLRVAMDAAQPGSLLTLATPAIDWSGSWDYDVIADNSDYLFIMGYAFAGSWSNPQPNAPLDAGGPWGTSRSLRWSVQDYVQWGGLYNADKIILGLPLYGYDWEATSDQIGADDDGETDVLFWDEFAALEVGATLGYESVSATPYAVWQEGSQWHQMWYEDVTSITAKAEMARDEGIGGFGFWAMNYDSNDSALWTGIQDTLEGWDGDLPGDDDDDDDDSTDPGDDDDSTDPQTGATAPELSIDAPSAVLVGASVLIDASATTDPDGLGLTWQWTPVNGPSVTLAGADTATPSFAAAELGVYGITVTVTDGDGDTDAGEVLIRSVPEEDADLLDEGDGCGCASAPRARSQGLGLALLFLCIIGVRRRR